MCQYLGFFVSCPLPSGESNFITFGWALLRVGFFEQFCNADVLMGATNRPCGHPSPKIEIACGTTQRRVALPDCRLSPFFAGLVVFGVVWFALALAGYSGGAPQYATAGRG